MPAQPPREIQMQAVLAMQQKQQAQAKWIAQYGHVRPIIASDAFGKKFVAVGNRLYYSERWKFIPDFLIDYVLYVFGKDWFDAEVAKPETERHPVFQLRVGCLRNRKTGLVVGNRREVKMDGMSVAYLSFAFNLFAIQDNSRLDDLLLRRLKHHEQFQGALHEVFAEATCLRAGFRIEKEDERDPTTRHAEFTATDKITGEQFSVEAKSRHRAGILGQPGVAQPYEKLNLTYGRLINDAIAKRVQHPLVIFLDTNLPFRSAHHVYGNQPGVQSRYIAELCKRITNTHGGQYPFAMLTLTNIPHHFSPANENDSPCQVHSIFTEPPNTNKGRALKALYDGVSSYGSIPNEFPTV
jgi:hypothetical protein